MTHRISIRSLIVAFTTICTMALCAGTLKAQMGPLTIGNNTACTVRVCDPNGVFCVDVPPGTTVVQVACNTSRITMRLCGTLHRIALGQCINNTSVAPGCCADVCFIPGFVACTFFLTINPTPGPCLCAIDDVEID